jgi:hypothetical protein
VLKGTETSEEEVEIGKNKMSVKGKVNDIVLEKVEEKVIEVDLNDLES